MKSLFKGLLAVTIFAANSTAFAQVLVPVVGSAQVFYGVPVVSPDGESSQIRFDPASLSTDGIFSLTNPQNQISVIGRPQPTISVTSNSGGDALVRHAEASLIYQFTQQTDSLEEFEALFNSGAAFQFDGKSEIGDSNGPDFAGRASDGRTLIEVIAPDGLLDPFRVSDSYSCGSTGIQGCGVHSYTLYGDVRNFADLSTLTFRGSVKISAFSLNKTGFFNPQTEAFDLQVNQSFAFIDPIISLSIGGVKIPNTRLFLSPGIGNGPIPTIGGVPETASWAMMIAGFGMIGGASRRISRRRATA